MAHSRMLCPRCHAIIPVVGSEDTSVMIACPECRQTVATPVRRRGGGGGIVLLLAGAGFLAMASVLVVGLAAWLLWPRGEARPVAAADKPSAGAQPTGVQPAETLRPMTPSAVRDGAPAASPTRPRQLPVSRPTPTPTAPAAVAQPATRPVPSKPAEPQAKPITPADGVGEQRPAGAAEPAAEPADKSQRRPAEANPGRLPATAVAEPPNVADDPTNKPAIGGTVPSEQDKRRLRYRWQQGKKYGYKFQAVAELGDLKKTTSGLVTYTSSGLVKDRQAPRREGSGSGFVVRDDGYLVTCAHVVLGATRLTVHFGDKEYSGRVIALDKEKDLAVVKIDAKDLPTIQLGRSADVELAQEIRAVGYPLTSVLGESIKITRGTVAGIIDRGERKLFQVDAPINPGNSGGPVVDDHGQVVGVATAKLSGRQISNVGFAVPTADVIGLLNSQDLKVKPAAAGAALSGPELARRTTPAVALLKVTTGPGGYGAEREFAIRYSGSFSQSERRTGGVGGGPFGGPFGGPRIRGPGIGGPFGRPQGDQGSGQISVTASGELTDGEQLRAQLPFILGPLGQLVIEPLGAANRKTWSVENELTITLGSSRDNQRTPFGIPRGFGPRGLRPPFAPPGRPQPAQPKGKTIPAVELYTYTLRETQGNLAIVAKEYEMETLAKDGPRLRMIGTGTLKFDLDAGVPHSLKFKATITQTEGDKQAEIPVTLTYEPVDLEALAAEAKRRRDELAKQRAKQEAERPKLNGEELDGVLKQLNVADKRGLRDALRKLIQAKPDDRRQEIGQALEKLLLSSSDIFIRMDAARALRVWCTKDNIDGLTKALSDSHVVVRHESLLALAELGDGESAEAICKVYKANRIYADRALMKIGAPAEAAIVKHLVTHTEWSIRFAACKLLEKLGTADSLAALRKLETDSNGLVKSGARRAVQAIEAKGK